MATTHDDETLVREHVSQLSCLQTDVATLKDSDDRQWVAINALLSRPPTWVTFAGTAMGAVVGALVTLVAVLANLKGLV